MEGDLPEVAIVVRGGILGDVDALREQAEDAALAGEGNGLSVWCDVAGDGGDETATIARLCRAGRVQNAKVRVTTAGEIRAAGLGLKWIGKNMEHYNVTLARI